MVRPITLAGRTMVQSMEVEESLMVAGKESPPWGSFLYCSGWTSNAGSPYHEELTLWSDLESHEEVEGSGRLISARGGAWE